MEQFPMFQTGTGRAVPISMASVQKAKAVLEENSINTGNVDYCILYINYKDVAQTFLHLLNSQS